MSLQQKQTICDIINKNPQAQGVYQFEVIRSLVTSKKGMMPKEEIIENLLKKCTLSASEIRSHCVWRVLSKKGAISLSQDKKTVTLSGFDNLNESEINEIRNQANQARRAWEAKQA